MRLSVEHEPGPGMESSRNSQLTANSNSRLVLRVKVLVNVGCRVSYGPSASACRRLCVHFPAYIWRM